MKLLDLLVKELPKRGGWPIKVTSIGQDYDRELMFYGRGEPRTGIILDDLAVDHRKCGYSDKGVTREQYESALAAIEGWIEWGGGNTPVNDDCIVDVKFRSGKVKNSMPARYWEWGNQCHRTDIIAYRLHKPDINSRASDDRLEQDLNECIGQDVDVPEWNGDGLPPAGCECEAKQKEQINWTRLKVIAVENGSVFGFWEGVTSTALNSNRWEFRPLRTESEKAREAATQSILDILNDYDFEMVHIRSDQKRVATDIVERIFAGQVSGIKSEGK